MRREATPAERVMWRGLRNRQLAGSKFRRQVPLGNYIVDFVSFEARLVVEVDGATHADPGIDEPRDAWLRAQGFRIMRFWNNDVMANPEGVLQQIASSLPSPLPLREGSGEGAPTPLSDGAPHPPPTPPEVGGGKEGG